MYCSLEEVMKKIMGNIRSSGKTLSFFLFVVQSGQQLDAEGKSKQKALRQN